LLFQWISRGPPAVFNCVRDATQAGFPSLRMRVSNPVRISVLASAISLLTAAISSAEALSAFSARLLKHAFLAALAFTVLRSRQLAYASFAWGARSGNSIEHASIISRLMASASH